MQEPLNDYYEGVFAARVKMNGAPLIPFCISYLLNVKSGSGALNHGRKLE